MDRDGINEATGMVDVYRLLPKQGDSIMIVNCGDHFEIRHHHFEPNGLALTDEDIQRLKQGQIIWN